MTAMDAYRAAHGSYRGFDAALGAAAEPSLEWIDGVPQPPFANLGPVVAIVSAADTEARVVAVSASSNGFCLQRMGSDLSYGRGSRFGAPHSDMNVIQQAMAACDSTTWSAAAVRRFPIATMCVGVEPDSYLICRVVQALMMTTMQRS